jgi:asparagine synthase (glutamine-hydrolysing)
MSGIAGGLRLDGQPASRAGVQRMLSAMSHRGPDGLSCWRNGSLALGHAMLRTTPESSAERQPLLDSTGDLCLVFDGRVDNRGELLAFLKAHGYVIRDGTDAELVLAAYDCWGDDSPGRILGDFAFAIWDERRQRLFCTRDPLGIRPLFYHYDRRTFRFASEIGALLAESDVPRKPNEGMVGEFLAGELCNAEETFLDGLLRVPAGHSITVDRARVQKTRHWNWRAARDAPRCSTDQEHAACFFDLFTDSVRSRVRSGEGVAAELSGGLDSASVVCVAARLPEIASASSRLETFSLTFPGMSCDEQTYIKEVARACRVPSRCFVVDRERLVDPTSRATLSLDWPTLPHDAMFGDLRNDVRRRGFRTVLTGQGGDPCFSGLFHPYVDLLAERRIADVWRQVALDIGRFGVGALPGHLYWHAFKPLLRRLLPSRVARAGQRLVPQRAVPSWIARSLVQRTALDERLRQAEQADAGQSTWHRVVRGRLESGWQAFYNDVADQSAARFGFEYRHPFLDRRIVEFSLTLPLDQYWRKEDRKIVVPRALHGVVPDSIRQRTTKAEFSEVLTNAFGTSERDQLFGPLRVADAGWVDPGTLRTMYDRMIILTSRGGAECHALASSLWAVIALEQWLHRVLSSSRFRDLAAMS